MTGSPAAPIKAAELILFGPQHYVKTVGEPNVFYSKFEAKAGPARLLIKSGDLDGSLAITSAEVWINEKRVVTEEDQIVNPQRVVGARDLLNQDFIATYKGTKSYFDIPIEVWAETEIRVKLNGYPDTFLTLQIVQPHNKPNKVHLTATTLPTVGGTMLTWGTASTATCSMDLGIGNISPVGSTMVYPKEPTTYTAKATDGKKIAETSVTVDPLPVMPIMMNTTTTTTKRAMIVWIDIDELAGVHFPCGKTFYLDADGDGFGDPNVPVMGCGPQSAYVVDNTDCNDADINENPDAIEIMNGIDENCNGQIDEVTTILQASAPRITKGNAVTLTWDSSSNAEFARIDPPVTANLDGNVATSGNATVTPVTTTVYTITASTSAGETDTYSVTVTVTASEDMDWDGMPDDWEVTYGLDPEVDDSKDDKDGDLVSNYLEYRLGTDPDDINNKPRTGARFQYSEAGRIKNIIKAVE